MENQERTRGIKEALENALARTTTLGMLMNLGIPAVLFALAVIFLSPGVSKTALEPSSFNLIFIILIAVSVADIGVGLFLKRRLLCPQNIFKKASSATEIATEIRFIQAAIVIHAINLSPTIYGFVLIFLGGKIENFLLFVAFTLIGFQLSRPRPGDMERLVRYHSRTFQSESERGGSGRRRGFPPPGLGSERSPLLVGGPQVEKPLTHLRILCRYMSRSWRGAGVVERGGLENR